MPNIVFVDEKDHVIGTGTKQQAWIEGQRHRIVRVFLFNTVGNILLARRGMSLASLPGRWNESAAGHVEDGESYEEAAQREIGEELGIIYPELSPVAYFKSEETDEPDKKKNRWTKVFAGKHHGGLKPNKREVEEIRWISPQSLQDWIQRSPNDFTEGCILGFKELVKAGIVQI